MRVDLSEFRSAYLAEVEEHLAAVEALLVKIEEGTRERRGRPRELRELMRLLHTVKGLSAMVDVEPIVTLTHAMESLVKSAESTGALMEPSALEALVAGTRAINARVKALAEDRAVPAAPTAVLAALEARTSVREPRERTTGRFAEDLADRVGASERQQIDEGVASGRRAVRIDFAPSRERADAGLTIASVRERLGALAEIVKILPLGVPKSAAAPGGIVFTLLLLTAADDATIAGMVGGAEGDVKPVLAEERVAALDGAPENVPDDEDVDGDTRDPTRPGTLRVEVGRIDEAIEGLASLITTRLRLARATKRLTDAGVDTREIGLVMADHARQLRDLRAAILRVRMVPMAVVFERLPLVVRSLAMTSGKRARLIVDGGEAEVDKTVAERLFPALVHLLRNAVDHGLEAPEARRAAGKPEEGLLRVSCSTKNRYVEVRMVDDGRGIDRGRVGAAAGRAPADDRAGLDEGALLNLLCTPGLSTRAQADTTSGRGMGMDIVRRIVEGLGGELALERTGREGTVFLVRVPLTIAVVDSFTVRCGGERFVVPVPLVEEIVEIDSGSLVHGPQRGDERLTFFARRGETVPLVDLARLLALPSAEPPKQALVVRRAHDEPVAFAVERVLGQQETVVRPLGDPLVNVAGISGSTDLGDGRATLVLDLAGLSGKMGDRAA